MVKGKMCRNTGHGLRDSMMGRPAKWQKQQPDPDER